MGTDFKLDSAIHLETPEGTQIELHPAGLIVRSLAFLIDELLRWMIIVGASIYLTLTGEFGQGLIALVFFVTYWLYGVLFEIFNNGMTPGKKMHGLQVVHDDGTPIRPAASLLRNLVLWVDLLPVFYLAGICSMALSDRFQRLGDLAAGTLVVYRPGMASNAELVVESGEQPLPIPIAIALSAEEQGVLVDFLERSNSLSPQRVDELAVLVGGAFQLSGDVTAGVKRIASSLRGQ